MFSYHDTVDEKGETLDLYEYKAKTQDSIVLKFFMSNPGIHFTPFDILEQCYMGCQKPPITSVRRAITNLERGFSGYEFGVKKSDKKKKGDYGRNNHTWYYIPQRIQTTLFNTPPSP